MVVETLTRDKNMVANEEFRVLTDVLRSLRRVTLNVYYMVVTQVRYHAIVEMITRCHEMSLMIFGNISAGHI